MTWLEVLALLLALVVLTALISSLVLFMQFRNSPAGRWRKQVLDLADAARQRARQEGAHLEQLANQQRAEARRLSDERFAAHLATISVQELDSYPGIGPATVAKLLDAGYANLATLRRARIRIHGLGEKRLGDITNAVRDLVGKAQAAFDGESCDPAKALPAELQASAVKYAALQRRAEARARAAQEVGTRLRKAEAVARTISFWRWLRRSAQDETILQGQMAAQLPNLETAIRVADEKAAAAAPSTQPIQSPPASTYRAAGPDISPTATLELMVKFAMAVARTDGPANRNELELIRQQLGQRFAQSQAMTNRVESLCAHYQAAAINLDGCLREIAEKFTAGNRTALMEMAAKILAASGGDREATLQFQHSLAQRLQVPSGELSWPSQSQPVEGEVPGLAKTPQGVTNSVSGGARPATTTAASATPSLATSPGVAVAINESHAESAQSRSDWLALLEIPSDAPISADLIRRQYNLLSQRLAPEKVASLGDEFVQMAEAKIANLRRAAEALLTPMGEKIDMVPPGHSTSDLRENPDLDNVFGGM